MHVLLETSHQKVPMLEHLSGSAAVPVAISKGTGNIANLNHGPLVLDQVREQFAECKCGNIHQLAEWSDLDHETRRELAMLTKESAPWVLDGKIHHNAAEELSAETQAKILGFQPSNAISPASGHRELAGTERLLVMVETTPKQLPALKRYVGDSNYGCTRAAISKDTGNIANIQHGPMVLEQLRQQLAEDEHGYIRKLAEWDDLDQEAQVEIALLTADSAPWAMDQEIHDSAAQDLSADTRRKILGDHSGRGAPLMRRVPPFQAHEGPAPISVAQSIQADQEAARMRHLKELLAKDFVDGLSRSHRSVIIADQLRSAETDARNIASVLEGLSTAADEENLEQYANAVSFLSRRQERRTNRAAELAAALEEETRLPL